MSQPQGTTAPPTILELTGVDPAELSARPRDDEWHQLFSEGDPLPAGLSTGELLIGTFAVSELWRQMRQNHFSHNLFDVALAAAERGFEPAKRMVEGGHPWATSGELDE